MKDNHDVIISIVGYEIGNPQISDSSLCSTQGVNVLRFTDAVNALEHFKINRKDYALMISDLRMPFPTKNSLNSFLTIDNYGEFSSVIKYDV